MFSATRMSWLLCIIFFNHCYADSPDSFNQAKRLASKIFSAKRETLYCACSYDAKNHVNLDSCHMSAAKPFKRANHIEWEHMMAAEFFGHHFKCWREALCVQDGIPYRGRKCCEKIDDKYKHMSTELYNLWPAVGLINQIRSNYNHAELSTRQDSYGCDFKIDRPKRRVEPSDLAKGIVARANLFMALHYGVPLTATEKKRFLQWHRQFPVSDWEKEWAAKVAKIEGYDNPYITKLAIADGN